MASLMYIVGASVIGLATAQTTIPGALCLWQEPRGGVVRDSLYIEGGLYGTWQDGKCTQSSSKYGRLFTLNFSVPFDTTSNLTQLFRPLNETVDPSAVTYVNGFMVADNDEWYTFGGQAYPEANQYTVNSGITRDAVYQPNPAASGALLGFTPNYQPTRGNLTNRYISNGGGVSVPSESLGFYFSGLRSPNSTNISWYPASSGYDALATLVSSMIKVDTSVFGESSWTNIPIPSSVTPRAEAAVVWIPTGPKGLLAIIGGVTMPADLPQNNGCFLSPYNVTANDNTGPTFMTSITIYDVASGSWYVQKTSGTAPPQLAQACAVVATASNTTHNIYLYGGYNGNDYTAASDDVWVLSLPSFTWVKAAVGTTSHGRYSQVCAKPYPDQMMIVGGTTQCGDSLQTAAVVDVFNLNTLKWTGSYDPTVWSEYTIPSVISDAIKATPTANMDSGLVSLFQTPYSGTLTHWYPYAKSVDPNVTSIPGPRPSVVVPVAAAVASVVGVALIILVWFFYRKHQKGKNGSKSQTQTPTWLSEQSRFNHSSNMSEAETARGHGMSHSIYEAYGDNYQKEGLQAIIAELQSSTDGNSTRVGSADGGSSPLQRSHRSIPSNSAELPNTVTRFELAADPIGFVAIPNIRNHPMYPASVDGHLSSAQSAGFSSQTTSAISSPTQSPSSVGLGNSGGLSPVPNDITLGASRTTPGYNWGPKSSDPKLGSLNEDMPSPSPSDISPVLNSSSEDIPTPSEAPRTPPAQTASSYTNMHTKNTSSLDSGLATLPSPGPNEESRRSAALATLPIFPQKQKKTSDNAYEQVTMPQQSSSETKPRKQVSAYEENDDIYGGQSRKTQAK